MGSRGQIAIRGVLEFVGVRADFSNLGWKVKSVDSNSMAERSGVKAGDLIEAINGLPVTDGTQFSGSFTGKNLRVKRDGKTVEIDLKPF
jgi:C-terminal processing protease CtpA/Prc